VNLLTIPQAAERLNCSWPYVYDLIAAKKLRRFNISAKPGSTKTRVAEADVAALARAAQPTTSAPQGLALMPAQVAARIGCSRTHIYDLIKAQKLRVADASAKNGRSITRIAAADVDAYIAAAEMPVAS
jgi:excisionase family DNA binding protein